MLDGTPLRCGPDYEPMVLPCAACLITN